MRTVRLGKTEITSPQNAFGALPVQRVSEEYAVMLLTRAFDAGFTFFDTARAYTDSEKKVGMAFSHMRDKVTIATKTAAQTGDALIKDLETSLRTLKTDYIDIYQLHNPSFCPRPGDGSGLYEALEKAKAEGKILHIGITAHRPDVAREAVLSGLYETLQFPFCYLATETDTDIVRLCAEQDVGFIAMKGLSGGLLTNSAAAYSWMAQFENVLPIWGIQRESELAEFIAYMKEPPQMTAEVRSVIERDRAELIGNFCRACGYCMPCPVGIEINNCARMSQLIRRSPSAQHLTEEARAKMMKIEECVNCGSCKSKCPYGLDTPELLRLNLADYKNILEGKVKI
ncbi:MAG: aldo/keto reductase [Ruminococcaceae bacterium]|nr:aldo/keto reductase [Oscillospiraceae bacterium]